LNQFGGPNTIIAAAVLFAASASLWHNMAGSVTGRIFSVAFALALTGLIILNWRSQLLDVRYAKGQRLADEMYVKWNSFSRIAVAKEKESGQIQVVIDADASTGIANFDFANLSERDRQDLLFQGPALPYAVRPGAKTLIIGPGGGWDVARALASGSRDVTGVEINRLIARTVMLDVFPHLSRNLYRRPDVRIVVEEGRSFIRRSEEKYEVIQATLVDTWASTAAGAFALSENNLYTVEAFVDYFNHLTEDGVLAFTRWGFDPPRESLRLVSLAISALERLGQRDAARHVIVGREGSVAGWGARDTVLFSRRPFSEVDAARARAALAASRMQAVYIPRADVKNPFAELLSASDRAAFHARYPFDVTPVTDNRPFFFYTVQPRDVWTYFMRAARDSADYKINRAIPLLFALVGVSLLATVVILALPPLVLGARLPREPGVRPFLLYFLCIGAGYILVEVALIQKLALFLGHPTYALTVVIFSMLLSSGLGSYWSRRLLGRSDGRLGLVLGGVAALVAMVAALLGSLLDGAVGWSLPAKIAVTVALLFPAGFAMGAPFPCGLDRLEQWHKPSVRWAWSLNAAASVLGSVASIVCAIYAGLIQTLLLGGAMYLAALVVLTVTKRARPGQPLQVS
ncbi:MAG: hypothetical protein ACRD96_25180, partial [Bryobacteraceae bacterium]